MQRNRRTFVPALLAPVLACARGSDGNAPDRARGTSLDGSTSAEAGAGWDGSRQDASQFSPYWNVAGPGANAAPFEILAYAPGATPTCGGNPPCTFDPDTLDIVFDTSTWAIVSFHRVFHLDSSCGATSVRTEQTGTGVLESP